MGFTRRDLLKVGGIAAGVTALGGATLAERAIARSEARALPAFGRPSHLDVADLTHLDGDTQAVFTTLQGVVNRGQPRLYWILANDGTDQSWLETIDVPHTMAVDPWSLVAKYRGEVRGVVIYDPDLPDSVNVATTMAGQQGAVIAGPDLAARLTAAPYHLPVLHDFRGAFTDKVQAYQWALQHLWPKCSHALLAGIAGGSPVPVPGVLWTTLGRVAQHVHDGSNKATSTFDISRLLGGAAVYVRFQNAYPDDGWGPSVAQVTVQADGRPIADFQPGTPGEQGFLFDADGSAVASGGWRFADQGDSFTYRFAPPAGTKALTLQVLLWNQYLVTATATAPSRVSAFATLRDLIVATGAFVCWLDPQVETEYRLFDQILSQYRTTTAYLGWFVAGHESHGVTLCARHGVEVLAADFFTNATVLGGVRAPLRAQRRLASGSPLRSRVYVTFTYSEGDNLQYDEHKLRQLWADPKRGVVPANWSINPLLADAAPSLLSYYQRTATGNDCLVAGPSGAGYTYPGMWPDTKLDAFTRLTGRYMRRTGMEVIYALNRNNDTDLPMSAAVADSYRRHADPLGILYNWETSGHVGVISGVPIVTQIGVSTLSQGQSALEAAAHGWDGASPLFVAIGVLAWNLGPADLDRLVEQLGAQYEVVRGDVFFRLLRQARGVPGASGHR